MGRIRPARLIGIGLRLSVVVGLVTGGYAYLQQHNRVRDSQRSSDRIWAGLTCAAKFDDAALEKTVHPLGNYDISKLGCGTGSGPNGAFIANRTEIEEARRGDRRGFEPDTQIYWSAVVNSALGSVVAVNVAAILAVLAWLVSKWVLFGGNLTRRL